MALTSKNFLLGMFLLGLSNVNSYDIKHEYSVDGVGYDENDNKTHTFPSLRFSSALDTNFYIFKYTHDGDGLYPDSFTNLLSKCLNGCHINDYCNGVYYEVVDNNSTDFCVGLSYTGKLTQIFGKSYSIKLGFTLLKIHLIQ